VDLPADLTKVALLEGLTPEARALFESSLSEILHPMEVSQAAGGLRPQNMMKPGHCAPLVKALLAAGMVEVTPGKPRMINSVFVVEKEGGRQRLIINARPANC